MLKFSYSITCVVIFNFLGYRYCQQFMGDYCTDSDTGVSGVCQLITHCPSAIQGLGKRISPQICGFEGRNPIVCCAEATSNVNRTLSSNNLAHTVPPAATEPPISSVVSQQLATSLRIGDTSRAKCKEYVDYAYIYAIPGAAPTPDCAISQVKLIVGGDIVQEKEFPHLALVGLDGEKGEKTWLCSGSLISEEFVLTAAHCLYTHQYREEVKYIRLGEMDLSSDTEEVPPQDFNVKEIFRHPEYRPPSRYNDIALLKLDRQVKLGPHVRPACLETNPNLTDTWKPIVAGWGIQGWSTDNRDIIQKITLEYFTNSECNEKYKSTIGITLRNGIVDNTQICAGSQSDIKDFCEGDFGGPLQVINKEEFCMYNIVGIPSFGKACGVAGIPDVYTRVSSYIKWIEEIVWP